MDSGITTFCRTFIAYFFLFKQYLLYGYKFFYFLSLLVGGVLSLIIVAFLWGVTNPLMGKGSSGIQRVEHANFLVQFGSELKFLLLNWKVSHLFSLCKFICL